MSKPQHNTAPETKSVAIRRLLSRKSGADLTTLEEVTGWQPHSVRAALSTLRKTGYQIDRLKPKTNGASAPYRITATPGGA